MPSICQLREHLAARALLAENHATLGILPMQMKAMLAKVNANQGNAVHDDGPQKEKSPLSLPLAGIGLTISLNPGSLHCRSCVKATELVVAGRRRAVTRLSTHVLVLESLNFLLGADAGVAL